MSPDRPYTYGTLSRALAEAREAKGHGDKTIHDLRRTFATRLFNAHVSPALIAALLGQRTTRLVGRYTHAEMDTLRAAAEAGVPKPPQLAEAVAAVAGGNDRRRSDLARKRKSRG